MAIPQWAAAHSPQRHFSLGKLRRANYHHARSLTGGIFRQLQSGDREPREIRGRLRHCDGLQVSNATSRKAGKAETRFETRSQDTGLVVLVSREDELMVEG